jgi:hypothetical protein
MMCPNCQKQHEMMTRQLYDQFQCSCDQWHMIAQKRNGEWYAVNVAPPVTSPREKQ